LLEETGIEIKQLEGLVETEGNESFAETVMAEVKDKKDQIINGSEFRGIPTYNNELDELLGGGFENSSLVVIGAKPGEGKTVWAMGAAKKAAEHKKPVLFESIEMSRRKLVRRYVIESSSVLMNKYRNNQLDSIDIKKIEFAASQLSKLPIHIYDGSICTPNKIRKNAKAVIKKEGSLALIVVDYLQMMRPDEKTHSREQDVASVSRELKAISKEFDCPVIALSSISCCISGYVPIPICI